MSAWTCEYTDDATGWPMRATMYNGGDAFSLTGATAISPECLRVEALSMAMRELPTGLMEPTTLTVVWNLTACPALLQSVLGTPNSGTLTSVFLLESKRAGAASYSTEFCGVVTRVLGREYLRDEGTVQLKHEYSDIASEALKRIPPTRIAAELRADGPELPDNFTFWFETRFGGAPNVTRYVQMVDNGSVRSGFGSTWTYIMARLRTVVGRQLVTMAKGTGTGCAFDDASALDNAWSTGVTLYREADAFPRDVGSPGSNPVLLTHALDGGGTVVGGQAADQDEVGFGRWETLFDYLNDLAENTCTKITYTTSVDTGADTCTVTVRISRILGLVNSINPTLNVDETGTGAGDVISIPTGETTVGQSEARIRVWSDRDKSEWRTYVAGSRATRAYGVDDLAYHNLPQHKPDIRRYDYFTDRTAKGFFQTNQLFFIVDGEPVKAHEQTYVSVRGAFDMFKYPSTVPALNALNAPPMEPWGAADDNAYLGWLANAQATAGIPLAVASTYARIFGDEDQATVEIAGVPLALYAADTVATRIGTRFTLTGAVATAVPSVAWTEAYLTAMDIDWTQGAATMTFTLIPQPTYD